MIHRILIAIAIAIAEASTWIHIRVREASSKWRADVFRSYWVMSCDVTSWIRSTSNFGARYSSEYMHSSYTRMNIPLATSLPSHYFAAFGLGGIVRTRRSPHFIPINLTETMVRQRDPPSRYDDDLSSLGVTRMSAKWMPSGSASSGNNRSRMSDEDWMSKPTEPYKSKIGYYENPERYDVTPSVQQAAEARDMTDARSDTQSRDVQSRDAQSRDSAYYRDYRDDDSSFSTATSRTRTRDQSQQSQWSESTTNFSERLEAYKKNAKAVSSPRRYVIASSAASDLTMDPPGKNRVIDMTGRGKNIGPDDASMSQLSIKVDVTNNSKEDQWNMTKLLSSEVGQALNPTTTPLEKQDLGLVSKVELFHDLKESGYDKVKEIFHNLGDGASQKSNLVGQCIVAPMGSHDSAPTSNKSFKDIFQSLGDGATQNTNRVGQCIVAPMGSYDSGPTSNKSFKDIFQSLGNGASQKTNLVGQCIVAPMGSFGSATNKEDNGFMARFVDSFSAGNVSVTYDVDSQKSDDESTTSSQLSNSSCAGKVDKKSAVPLLSLKPKKRSIMVNADSVSSGKSVRFSDKVETSEAKEIDAPELPSLMDSDPVEAEDGSVASADSSTSKKQGLFKSWMRRKRQKSKSKQSMKDTFQPSLEPMNEVDELQSFGAPVESLHGADGAKALSKDSSKSGSDVEGIELIAGCTKSGKKAIMIARAIRQPKAICRDPPTLDEKKEESAAPVVASFEKGTAYEESSLSKMGRSETNSTSTLSWLFPHMYEGGEDAGSASTTTSKTKSVGKKIKDKQWKEIIEATETLANQYQEHHNSLDDVPSMDEEVSSALTVIRKHANRLDISERRLMEVVQSDERSVLSGLVDDEGTVPDARSTSGRSTGSFQNSVYTTDSSHFRTEHPMATKLIDMFDSFFAAGDVEDAESFQSAAL
jgi:hypothetical protein